MPRASNAQASATLRTAAWPLPLTAVRVVCASREGLSTLAPEISAFIDPAHPKHRRWTVERACERGYVRLLQRLVNLDARANKPALYRSHVFSRALVHAVAHDNDLALLECLHSYCPSGFVSLGFEAAAGLGKLQVLQWLAERYESDIIWTSRFAVAAARNGHLETLQWLWTAFWSDANPMSLWRKSWMLSCRMKYVVKAAITGNHLAVVQWVIESLAALTCDVNFSLRYTDMIVEAYIDASLAGNVEVFQYLVDLGVVDHVFHKLLHNGVKSGNLAMVQYLYDNGHKDVDTTYWRVAASAGHADILRWLMEHNDGKSDMDPMNLQHMMSYSSLEVLQVLYEKYPALMTTELLTLKFPTAAKAGDLALLEWVFPFVRGDLAAPPSDMNHEYSGIRQAAAQGHLAVVQWLFHTVRPFASDADAMDRNAVGDATRNGHTDVAEWLHAHRHDTEHPPYDITAAAQSGDLAPLAQRNVQVSDSRDMRAVDKAIAGGDLATVKWLFEDHGRLRWRGGREHITTSAAAHGHLHILQYLHAHCGEDKWTTSVLDSAASLEIVEWLHSNRSDGCTTKVMDTAAARGDFDTLLFLHEHRTEGCSVLAAASAHDNGHLVVFQWLMETFPAVLDIDDVQIRMMDWGSHFEPERVRFWSPLLTRQIDRW